MGAGGVRPKGAQPTGGGAPRGFYQSQLLTTKHIAYLYGGIKQAKINKVLYFGCALAWRSLDLKYLRLNDVRTFVTHCI